MEVPESDVACCSNVDPEDIEKRLVATFSAPKSSTLKSNGSGSGNLPPSEPSAACCGLCAGETSGDVCRDSGTLPVVSKTKNASPPSPNFMK